MRKSILFTPLVLLMLSCLTIQASTSILKRFRSIKWETVDSISIEKFGTDAFKLIQSPRKIEVFTLYGQFAPQEVEDMLYGYAIQQEIGHLAGEQKHVLAYLLSDSSIFSTDLTQIKAAFNPEYALRFIGWRQECALLYSPNSRELKIIYKSKNTGITEKYIRLKEIGPLNRFFYLLTGEETQNQHGLSTNEIKYEK